jgi:hypothetical protein
MRKGSGLKPSLRASVPAIGPSISTVGALCRNGVITIEATRMTVSAPSGGSTCTAGVSQPAMRSVPPVDWTAWLTGMSAASRTSTCHSTVS